MNEGILIRIVWYYLYQQYVELVLLGTQIYINEICLDTLI